VKKFDLPAQHVPIDLFEGFFKGLDSDRCQKQPRNGFRALRRINLFGQHGPQSKTLRHIGRGAVLGSHQRDLSKSNRQFRFAFGLAWFRRDFNGVGAANFLAVHKVPQIFFGMLDAAVELGAHQSRDGGTASCALDAPAQRARKYPLRDRPY